MSITRFDGEFAFLSNFFLCGSTTAEHLFQARKTLDIEWQQRIMAAETPGRAKRLGRKAPLRSDWEQIKVQVMHEIVREKFTSTPGLKAKLLATGNEELIEGNTWGDTFWGVCNGQGQNRLGQILMEVRQEIRIDAIK